MKKKTIADCKKTAQQKDGQCLSAVYENGNTKMLWQCKLEHKWFAVYNNIIHGRWCPYCAGKYVTIEDCRRAASINEGKCLSEKYITSITKYLWECKFGHQWLAVYNNIQQGQWCPDCTTTKKKTIEDCKQIAKQNNGDCLSEKYINCKTKMLWKCNFGHRWSSVFDKIVQGCWCPECSRGKNQRQLFEIIKNIFISYSILYNFRGFEWLKLKKKLELDIFVKDLKLAIEYDGKQHFNSVEFWGGNIFFDKTKERDQLKNNLIAAHPDDVKHFIRIPYWEAITEENVRRILAENGVI